MTRLRYWLYLCDEYAMHSLIGPDPIKAIVARDRRAELLRAAFGDDDHRRRTP